MCSLVLLFSVLILNHIILGGNPRKLDKVSFVPSSKSSHVFKRMTSQTSAQPWWTLPPTKTLISPRQRSRLTQSGTGLTPRIIGGHLGLDGYFPFLLSIIHDLEFECGATLVEVVGLHVALTAAHCVYPYPPTELILLAGHVNLLKPSGREQTRKAVHYIIHEDFNSFTDQNDIAIIFLESNFDLNPNIRPARLPDQGWYDPVEVEFSGFGAVMDGGKASLEVMWVHVRVMSSSECLKYMYHGVQLTSKQLCTGGPTIPGGGEGQCDGDSGGPGMSNNYSNGRYHLAAIPSYGLGRCGDPVFPEVSTRVSAYVDWINYQIADYHINGIAG